MMPSRRHFLSTVPATAIALTTLPAVARAGAPRERKNVKKLTKNSPDILALKKAIEKMRAIEMGAKKGEKECHSWKRMAEIHGKLDSQTTNQCRHFNWFFFPWHRAYVYAFEQIVRELGENDDFALPFWAWEEDRVADLALPTLFADNGIDTFNNPKRNNIGGRAPKKDKFTQDQIDGEIGKAFVDGLLASNFQVFAGNSTDLGVFEDGPHQFIHKWVRGDMLTAGCAYDPVFWLHHCNVDRYWDKWAARHPKATPDDKNWLSEKLGPFCDGTGKDFTLTVAEVLGDQLGYKYEGTTAASKMQPGREWRVTASEAKVSLAGKEWKPAPGNTAIAYPEMTVAATNKFGEVLKGNLAEVTLRIRLQGFSDKLDPDVSLRVYLMRGQAESELTPKSPGYVGTIPVIRGWHHPKDHKDHKDAPTVLDATRAFRRLYSGKDTFPPKGNTFAIQVVPVPIDGSKFEGKVSDYYPQETLVDVLAPEG